MLGSRAIARIAPAAVLGLLAVTAVPVAAGTAGAALAAAGTCSPPAGAVNCGPATWTPHLPNKTDTTWQVRQLVQCGSLMYAVGKFHTIIGRSPKTGKSVNYSRNGAFSFKATYPFTVTSWNPNVNGVVNSVAVGGRSCAEVYLGGSFTKVHGATVRNLVRVTSTTGRVVQDFRHSAGGTVETLLLHDQRVLAGGYFTNINGSLAHYYAGLNPATGVPDTYLRLSISGNYQYTGVASNDTRVYNQQLSPDGTRLLVEGDFTSVGGVQREQIFMLNVAGATAAVTGWTSPEFDGSNPAYPYQCATVEPFYIQAAAWSPDDSTVYIGTTGYHPNGYPVGETPRTGLCDAAAAFPATQTSVLHEWVNYTGCDSLYSAAADASAVYLAGHERFSMNPGDCDALGDGGYNAPGMEGLDPANGNLYTSADGTVGYYSRDRGLGADDELLTSAGLWIASDNLDGSQMCGGVQNLSGICFLPYS
jgi:hypothetical protein